MDDDEMIMDVVGSMLESLGYEVGFSRDGAEAINLYSEAKASNRPFDAIIMDLTIPGGMGGLEAVRKLLKIDPNVKAIVSSGYSYDPIVSDYFRYGFAAAIAKPYRIEDISKIILKVLDRSKNIDI